MTDPTRWAEARRLLDVGREVPAADRAAWLAEACPDSGLRAEVAGLLEAEDRAASSGFLNGSAADWSAPFLADEPDAHEGRAVGPWRLVERLGEGGMGVVYRAERADGLYEQTVALKLVARGVAPEALRRRLRHERRILARLAHPHIARLIDGGVTDDGQPYLAMELAEGAPLTQYARDQGLDVRARLGLFVGVCEAVAHAHRHLVVHRDLKPSNVVVVEDDAGRPRVRLLDFGIATLLDGEADGTMTQTGRLLTPAYAAPEQVRGGGLTTATDVYALGVVLYELLADRRPYELGPELSPTGVERVVCETEPPAPSAVAPAGRRRALRGDLDTIVGKAMRKAPADRYASADALADDLRRHLDGLPIAARPATVGYRVRSFVRRHPVGVGATALVALALLLGLAGTTWQARVAAAERDRAQSEADRANQTADFLRGLFAASDPYNPDAEGDTLRARTLLLRGAARLETELAGQPAVRAALLHEIGVSLRGLGQLAAADSLLAAAEALQLAHLGPASPDLGTTLYERSVTLDGLGDYDGVTATARRALAVRRAALAPGHPDLGQAMDWLATVHEWNGEPDSALALERGALALLEGAVPPGDDRLIQARHNLGWMLQRRGDYAAADAALARAVADTRAHAPDHPELASTLSLWGLALRHLGRLEEAEALYREALDRQRARLGPDHAEVATTLNNLARLPLERGDLDEAERLYGEALAIFRHRLGPDAFNNGVVLAHLAGIARRRGRLDDAERLAREALALHERAFPDGSTYTASALVELARVLSARGRLDEAERRASAALALREAQFGPDHEGTAEARALLADVRGRRSRT